jgi:hypothetical protein
MSLTVADAVSALAGGAIIGVASALLLAFHGRIAGISGMLAGVLDRSSGLRTRIAFLLGLAAAGTALYALQPARFEAPRASLGLVVVAGLLVGFGTRLSGGCTSGHGVCGTGRLSARSMAATGTFIAAGALTVLVLRYVGGGA